MRWISLLTNLYPLWTLSASVAAIFIPQAFLWFRGPWIVWGLALVMLGMGMTLTLADFRRVGEMPRCVMLGFALQYSVMPAAGWAVARLLQLPPEFAVGLILVACCPGGTASNVVAFLARANVALSVVMTMLSTLAAIFMTPLLVQALAGAYVPVDALGIFLTTVQVILLPVLLGVYCNYRFPRAVQAVGQIGPLVSVFVIVMIAGSIVAQNAAAVVEYGLRLALASILLHAAGFSLGYHFARLLRIPIRDARTISIEVGMQNSGLGMVLAQKHYSSQPLIATPAAFSSIFHTVLGSLLAGYWRMRSESLSSPIACLAASAADSASVTADDDQWQTAPPPAGLNSDPPPVT